MLEAAPTSKYMDNGLACTTDQILPSTAGGRRLCRRKPLAWSPVTKPVGEGPRLVNCWSCLTRSAGVTTHGSICKHPDCQSHPTMLPVTTQALTDEHCTCCGTTSAIAGGGALIAGHPPPANHRGPTYIPPPPPPKPRRAPTGPFEPQSDVHSLSGFRSPRDGAGSCMVGQAPIGRIRGPRGE